jgi:hypothetical protein
VTSQRSTFVIPTEVGIAIGSAQDCGPDLRGDDETVDRAVTS